MSIPVARSMGLPLVFDADGLPHEERVEDSEGRAGFRYWVSRAMEQACLQSAHSIIARSESGKAILQARAGGSVCDESFYVASNGRDPTVFRPFDPATRAAARARLGIPEKSVVAMHLGSIGPKYRPDWLTKFGSSFLATQEDRRLIFVTGHREAAESIRQAIGGKLAARVIVLTVEPDKVPGVLSVADIGIAFIRRSFSSLAVSPIKVGEYLLSGCPVICSGGIGDLDNVGPKSAGALTIVTDPVAARRQRFFTREQRPRLSEVARSLGVRQFSDAPAQQTYRDAIRRALARNCGQTYQS